MLPCRQGRRARPVPRRRTRLSPARRLRRGLSMPSRVSGPISWRCGARASRSTPQPSKATASTLALVLAGRHRGQNELPHRRRTGADRRRRAGAWSPAARRMAWQPAASGWPAWSPLDGQMPKYHGWPSGCVVPPIAAAVVAALRAGATRRLRSTAASTTAPGMFSHDRVDRRLGACSPTHLPADLSGTVADFCAGWGYLAAEVARRAVRSDRRRSISTRRISSPWRPPGPILPASAVEIALLLARPLGETGDASATTRSS